LPWRLYRPILLFWVARFCFICSYCWRFAAQNYFIVKLRETKVSSLMSFTCLSCAVDSCSKVISYARILFLLAAMVIQVQGGSDAQWVLLFRQTKGTYLDAANWMRHNADDPSSAAYSILDTTEDFRGADGKFHFKLKWSVLRRFLLGSPPTPPASFSPFVLRPIFRDLRTSPPLESWTPLLVRADTNTYHKLSMYQAHV